MTFDEWWNGYTGYVEDSHGRDDAKAAWKAATEAEREACAKLVETIAITGPLDEELGKRAVAASIRMRSNVKFSGPPAALSPEAPLQRRVGGG